MCWYCGTPVTNAEPIGRSQICPDCGKDLRSCCNCRHYLKAERGCAESQSENPSDKERANFCDWFNLNPKFREATGGEKKSRDAQGEAKAAFNNLFN